MLLGLVLLETLIKLWAAAHLTPGSDRVLLPGVLHLGFTLNPGMAWGLLGGLSAPLAALRLLVGLGLLWALLTHRLQPAQRWPLVLVAAGALGNAVDGLTRGAVVDYLTSPLLDTVSMLLSRQAFPIFNVSDVLVSGGVLWLLVSSRRSPPQAAVDTAGGTRRQETP
ncbi:lipoprotein signal peptidase [Deinococcus ruber]|uniref:Lipoprotein signal peptidase n=1 Tax=Deinococcus ruber TaxID=1848197 RepID=A0A918CL81_9DEIO|nr:lipoprotein signal peptidase [Deinococcus ruber]